MRRAIPLAAVGILIPAVAMLFTDAVNWTFLDFVVAFCVMVLFATIYYALSDLTTNKHVRALVALLCLVALLLSWSQMI